MMFPVIFLNTLAIAAAKPFEILGDEDKLVDASSFVRQTGIPALGEVLNVVGVLSAMIIILVSIAMLLVANYPKTVAQTKEKIVNALMTVAFIAAFPLVADVIYSVIVGSFY